MPRIFCVCAGLSTIVFKGTQSTHIDQKGGCAVIVRSTGSTGAWAIDFSLFCHPSTCELQPQQLFRERGLVRWVGQIPDR